MNKKYLIPIGIFAAGIIGYQLVPEQHSTFCDSLHNADGVKACNDLVNASPKNAPLVGGILGSVVSTMIIFANGRAAVNSQNPKEAQS